MVILWSLACDAVLESVAKVLSLKLVLIRDVVSGTVEKSWVSEIAAMETQSVELRFSIDIAGIIEPVNGKVVDAVAPLALLFVEEARIALRLGDELATRLATDEPLQNNEVEPCK